MCLCACVLGVFVYPICFAFEEITKYRKNCFDLEKYLEPAWISMMEFFAKKLMAKSL